MEEKNKIDKTTEHWPSSQNGKSTVAAPTQASLEFRQRFPDTCSSTVSRPPQKKPKLTGYVPAGKAFLPKDTWTHEFCVLSGRDEDVTPSRERLITLADAGLGKAKHCTLLKEMFPNSKMVALRSTLDSCGGDINKDAEILDGWKDGDDVTSDDELPSVSEIFEDPQPANEAGSLNPLSLSVAEVLHMYRKQVRPTGKEFVMIKRMQISMIQQLMRIYKNPKLDFKKLLDVDFVGEQGADVGGPTKEFFYQAICALTKVDPLYNLQLFGGQEGHLIPLYGIDAISSGCFEMAGKLLAHSILHGGPGLSGLSPCIIKYLTIGSVDKARDLITTEKS